ncbi:unnamed protein product [Brassica napus]|uniref:(rape) hypothetical protein n=1 Tax=Brassica napus TaxID=3708 RepID=A0A816KZ86_BRANA|nr:unnamed protein product [Brassica napus]
MGEDGRQEVYIVGLQEYEVSYVQIVKELVEKGAQGQLEQMRSHLHHLLSYNFYWEDFLSLILLAVKEVQKPQKITARQGEDALYPSWLSTDVGPTDDAGDDVMAWWQ